MENLIPTERTTLKRLPKRAEYDRASVCKILDEGFVCHVGFVVNGQPFVVPTGYGRIGDRLYIHGSAASRMMKAVGEGIEVCMTVTLVDGLVLARSAFHHSMNYRSVMVFGRATVVEDAEEKMEALKAFTEHIVPGRWAETRWPNESEMKATTVLMLPLAEASAKIRTGPPIDDEEDYELNVWAGVLPLRLQAGEAINDDRLPSEISLPEYVRDYRRPADSRKEV